MRSAAAFNRGSQHDRAPAAPVFEVVEEQEAKLEEMNVGEEPIAARQELGSEKRRRMSQCTKLNSPKEGVFMVSQSNDEQMGVLAAATSAEIIGNNLGQNLDDDIRNLSSTEQAVDVQATHVDAHVRKKIRQAFQEIAHRFALQTKIMDGLDRMSAKPALVKMVDMPGGGKTMFVGSTGDSRVYLQRNGELHQLSDDKTDLRKKVESGKMTEEEFGRIDQAVDPSKLDREGRADFGLKDKGGELSSDAEPEIFLEAYDVLPGDRIIIGNEGLHNNLLASEMEDLADSDLYDDRTAEKMLQKSADNQAGAALPRGRSSAKEIAAVVYTVPEGRRDQWKEEETEEREASKADVEALIQHHASNERAIKQAKRQVEGTYLRAHQQWKKAQEGGGRREVHAARDELKKAKDAWQSLMINEAEHSHKADKAQAKLYDMLIPPKLGVGERVMLDAEAQQMADVVGYDEESNEYIVQLDSGQEMRGSRADIETLQPGFMPKVDDVVPIFDPRSGTFIPGYRVKGLEGGSVKLQKDGDQDAPFIWRNASEIRGNMKNELRKQDQLVKALNKNVNPRDVVRDRLAQKARSRAHSIAR
jgi:serine/threonine protein phosphatase PrpC